MRRADFLRVQGRGQKLRQARVTLFVARSGDGPARVGYTVTRKVGNAVVRNRVRRRLREIVRLNQGLLVPATDYVVMVSPAAREASYDTLARELVASLERARGLLQAAPS